MKRNVMETVLGAVVLVVAGGFFAFSYKTADVSAASGYEVTADFSGIGGLGIGDPVELSGVKVGTVSEITLTEGSYLAHVKMDIDPKIKLPSDTVALISSQSLLGGRYLALEPGADEEVIPNGGKIQYTQAPQNLEQLLGQFIFSMKDAKDQKQASAADATTAAAPAALQPAPAATEATPAVEKTDTAAPADAIATPDAAEAPKANDAQ